MSTPRVLIIEDDPDGLRSVQEAIEDAGLTVITAATGAEGVAAFKQARVDTVLTDLVLPDIEGTEVMRQIQQLNPQVPILIMTAYGSVDSSVKALKSGAYDYISKPLDLDDIQSKITRAVETYRLRSQVEAMQHTLHDRYSCDAILAASPAMREIIEQTRALADTNVTVLISGESGTGKELIARALHVDSQRRAGPFVAVNCGAFTETLLESEIFGHEKGAFTGATNRHRGAFERATNGTLFLDEIGDAPPSVQVKLLRVLEESEIMRVGGQEPVPINVRLVSASNKDLGDLVDAGTLREDLLYRLNVVTIALPPLRDRRADIRPLADRFISMAAAEHGRSITTVDPAYYEALEHFSWPGNVRQLRNVVEASVVMARTPVLNADALQLVPRGGVEPDSATFTVPDDMTLADCEKEILIQLLSRNEGNRTLTAEKLGISRRTIQRKIQDYGLPF